MDDANTAHHDGQPNIRREIRNQIATLLDAMDSELEEAATEFAEWWLPIREDISRCKAVPTSQSDQLLPLA